MSNWKKKKIIHLGDKIYNLENWTHIRIENKEVKYSDGPKLEPTLVIQITDTRAIYCNKYHCENENMDEVLGLPAGTIDALFLAAECL